MFCAIFANMKILLVQLKMNKRPMDTDLKTCMSPSLALLTLLNLTPAATLGNTTRQMWYSGLWV